MEGRIISQSGSFATSGGGSGTVTAISAGTGITLSPDPITSTGSVALTIPVAIENGGTNATSMTDTDGVIYFDGTSLVTTAVGTAAQVLTSNGPGEAPTFQDASPGSAIVTIDGDTGSVSGSTITLESGVASNNSGATVLFSGSGATMTLQISDPTAFNTFIGHNVGTASLTSTANTAVGYGTLSNIESASPGGNGAFGFGALQSLTTGEQNTGLGENTLLQLETGNNNTAIGAGVLSSPMSGVVSGSFNTAIGLYFDGSVGVGSGDTYTTSESANILINNAGVVGDNNTIRIGTHGNGTGQQNAAYIAGISGVTPSGTNQLVTINTSHQLGSTPIPNLVTMFTGDTGTAVPSAGDIIFFARPNSGSSVTFAASGSRLYLTMSDSNENTIVGTDAGNLTVSGVQNTVFGSGAAPVLAAGSTNTVVGTNAAGSITSGSNNILVGNNSGNGYATGSESNNIILGPSLGTNNTSGEMWLGDFTNTTSTYVAGVVGTTISSPHYVTVDPTTGQIGATSGGTASVSLTGDTGGTLTASSFTITGSQAGASVSFSGSGSTLFLNLTNSSFNTYLGFDAGVPGSVGSANTAVGFASMQNVITGGGSNSAFGAEALQALTSAEENVAVGGAAGKFTTTGNQNIFIGYEAGLNLITGTANIVLGVNALPGGGTQAQSTNIAIGALAGNSYATGTESFNIILGDSAGTNNTSHEMWLGRFTPSSRTLTTYMAGVAGVTVANTNLVTINTSTGQLGSTSISSGITTLAGNTGSATGSTVTVSGDGANIATSGSSSTLSLTLPNIAVNAGSGQSIAIGIGATVTGSPSIALGTGTAAGGSISIGDGICPSSCTTIGWSNASSTGSSTVIIGNTNTGSIGSSVVIIGNSNTAGIASNALLIGNSNNNSIGSGSIVLFDNLGVSVASGTTYIDNIVGSSVTGSAVLVTSDGQLGVAVSSKRFKKDIQDMGETSVLDLRPVTFKYQEGDDKETQYGLIAEEVEEVMPLLVHYDKEELPYSIKYHDLPVLLLNEIKKLKARIEILEAR